ncbi:MAG: addiction module protein [Gammaproteobacteria bacterium]|nr:addiction module protein [Gammaproteobacteria bacterium]
MGRDVSQLEAEARQLPPEDRARLARCLIATLDAGDEADDGQAWLDDATQRLSTWRPG